MATSWGSDGFYVMRDECYYYGNRIPNPPNFKSNSINVTTINDKIYLNGYEFFPNQCKWRRTFKAIWYYIF